MLVYFLRSYELILTSPNRVLSYPRPVELLLDGFLHQSAWLETTGARHERLPAGCASAARIGGCRSHGGGGVAEEGIGSPRGQSCKEQREKESGRMSGLGHLVC